MLAILKKLFSNPDADPAVDGFSQIEREALIDTLLLAMYSDNHLALDEAELLKSTTAELAWESGTTLDIHLQSTTSKVRAAIGDAGKEAALMDDIAFRLDSTASKQKVAEAVENILHADQRLTDEEQRFFTDLRSHLGV